jgi:predicted Zn-dependent protease
MRWVFARLGCAGAIVTTLILCLGAAAAQESTVEEELCAPTPRQIREWGELQLQAFLDDHPETKDLELLARVIRVGRRIASVSDRPDQIYHFKVVEGGAEKYQAYDFRGGDRTELFSFKQRFQRSGDFNTSGR